MGLLAVKIAQMYAVRSDLLNTEKCVALQKLYEKTTPVAWNVILQTLQKDAPSLFWKEVKNVEQTALAAASLGQVHRARHIDGTEVVIKVIKPRASEEFLKDMRAVTILARVALFFYPKLKRLADPLGTLAVISNQIALELDLRNEIMSSERLKLLRDEASHLKHLSRLHFPKMFPHLSSHSVLVSEFIPYQSVSEGLVNKTFQYHHLLNLFRTQGYYLFLKAQFHGDLHPGNVFFHEEELWFIDNGNLEQANPHFTKGLLAFLGALGKSDFPKAARIIEALSASPPFDQEEFYEKFSHLYASFESGKSSLTYQMMETVKLCVHSGMEFPEGTFPVIKSLMYLDGMALQCKPDADLLSDVLQYTHDLS